MVRWVHVRLDDQLIAVLAPLLTLSQQLKWSWVKLVDHSRLRVKVAHTLLDISDVIEIHRDFKSLIKRGKGYLFHQLVSHCCIGVTACLPTCTI